MSNDSENAGIILTDSVRHSDPAEMVSCLDCSRLSPPERVTCLYCGKDLPVSEAAANAAPKHLRQPEAWENGLNVIFDSLLCDRNELKMKELCDAVPFEPDELLKIINTGGPFPLFRAATEGEAQRLSSYLHSNGLKCVIIDDETLAVSKLPRRVRRIEFFGDLVQLILFNTDEIVEAKHEDIGIFVAGAIVETKKETSEKRKRGKSEITDQAEMRTDEMVIDLYLQTDTFGYRIVTSGFDFSGLGVGKTMIGLQNMAILGRMLREFAPDAKWIDYRPIAALLDPVWELEERSSTQGLNRTGFGKIELQRTGTASNLQQFTKFSRMHRHFL